MHGLLPYAAVAIGLATNQPNDEGTNGTISREQERAGSHQAAARLPEDLEVGLTPQQMADLLEFISTATQ